MKIVGWVVALILVVLAATFAIHNREPVSLNFWPFLSDKVVLPAFLVMLALLAIGFVIGAGASWYAGRKWRRLARARGRHIDELMREIEAARSRTAEAYPDYGPPAEAGERRSSVPSTGRS